MSSSGTASRVDRNLLLAVLAAAAFFRLIYLNLPFLEPYNSMARQAIGAQIARNFFRDGFDFFRPEIDANGAGLSLFNGEMPFVPYLAALLYRLSGGVHEFCARSVSVTFSLLGLWLLYRVAKKLTDRRSAVWATAIAAFSPLSVALSRTLQPEALMGCASLGFVYFSLRYRDKSRLWDVAVAAFFLFVAVGAKFYNGYLLLLTVGWYLDRRHFAVGRWTGWLAIGMLGAALALSLAWSVAMWDFGRQHHDQLLYNAFQFVAARGPADMSYLQILLSPAYLLNMLKSFSLHLLTVPVAVLWLYFWTQSDNDAGIRIARRWMLLALVLMLVIWRTAIDHPYYQYPLLFPAAIIGGWSISRLWKRFGSGWGVKAITAAALLLYAVNTAYLYQGLYEIPDDKRGILAAAQHVRTSTPSDSLVLASHWTNEMLLYYCDRKGWAFNMVNLQDDVLIAELERKRLMGAEYFVTSTPEEFFKHTRFSEYMTDHHSLLSSSASHLLYKLNDKS